MDEGEVPEGAADSGAKKLLIWINSFDPNDYLAHTMVEYGPTSSVTIFSVECVCAPYIIERGGVRYIIHENISRRLN